MDENEFFLQSLKMKLADHNLNESLQLYALLSPSVGWSVGLSVKLYFFGIYKWFLFLPNAWLVFFLLLLPCLLSSHVFGLFFLALFVLILEEGRIHGYRSRVRLGRGSKKTLTKTFEQEQ